MKRGKLISIEGIEGAGKSTAMQFMRDYLAQTAAVFTREPGGTELAEEIRQVLLHSKSREKMQPTTELLLMFAGRAQHLGQCIQPALQAGKWVVSDRYIDATYAYQGGGRQLDLQTIKLLDQLVVGAIYPDLTLLLDIPAPQGVARAEKRGNEKDRIEQEKIDFFERVRAMYLERARQDAKRIKLIDASKDLQQVQAQMRHVLDEFCASNTP